MTHRPYLLAIAFLPLVFAGCKRSEAADALPPAEGPGAPPLPSAPVVDNANTVSKDSERVLRATGSTHALHQAELGPKGSGVLAAVMVEEGDKVRKGQPLFRLEATNPALQVKQAEASLAQARVGLTRAELDYNRMKPLLEQGAISQANWDAVRIGYDQAKVGVQQAEAAVASARAIANDTLVVAPFAGIVTEKRKNAGETVTMMPATTVVVLQDLSKIEVRVKLAETALSRIKPGEPMQVRFSSLNIEKPVPIDRINPAVDPMSRTVEVVGVIPNEDRFLKAGMLVEVTFPNSTTTPAASPAASATTTAKDAPAPAAAQKGTPKP
ncbi:MAG TPA: efflux RND transporter periplasmic adaptor subunit [Polyangiaceae bacterium]